MLDKKEELGGGGGAAEGVGGEDVVCGCGCGGGGHVGHHYCLHVAGACGRPTFSHTPHANTHGNFL